MWNAFKKQSCPKCWFHQLGTRYSQFYSSTKMMARRYACAKIISRGAKYLRMAATVEVTSDMIFPDLFSDVTGDNFLIHVQTGRFNFFERIFWRRSRVIFPNFFFTFKFHSSFQSFFIEKKFLNKMSHFYKKICDPIYSVIKEWPKEKFSPIENSFSKFLIWYW